MRRRPALLTASWLLLVASLAAQQPTPRVLSLRIDAKGRLFEGPNLRISRATLLRDLKNGQHDGPYDTILISASPATRYGRVKEINDLIEQYGPAGVKVSLTQK